MNKKMIGALFAFSLHMSHADALKLCKGGFVVSKAAGIAVLLPSFQTI